MWFLCRNLSEAAGSLKKTGGEQEVIVVGVNPKTAAVALPSITASQEL